ncbi:N-acetylglucosamine repressor [Pullulanibacillus camelliae]|uniref:N-acetylglucosamine repressor n=1 Tax=Pullulanibacillus camelliae TaxID=1707096 RepID=A0A8J2VJQ5_9BACL|nr:ROK family transcriptional regulator [Pullulanibacillus camelliae]GGE27666.1 N-acetylglucosamine repressor [Pullulanibacillus camelliae]
MGNWNQQLVKILNLNKILSELRISDETSRVELSKRLNLGKSTITSLVGNLIDSGCVQEVGSIESPLGRNPKSLRLNATWRHIIAVHFDTPLLHLALIDLKGNKVSEKRITLEEQVETWHSISELMKASAQQLCSEEGLDWQKDIIGVSVALPGIIDIHSGKAWSRIIIDQSGVSIQELLMNTFQKRVLVDNDVRALAMAVGRELDDEESDMVTLLVGKGVGAGIVSNGQLIRGGALGAGQVGHIKVSQHGPLCHCGDRGCLESFISNDALLEAFQTKCLENPELEERVLEVLSKSDLAQIEIKDIALLAKEDVKEALQIIEDVSKKLGKLIHVMVQTLNPNKVLLAGPLFDGAAHIMIPKLSEQVKTLTQAYLSSHLVFEALTNYEEHIISGIANFILDEIYAPPIYKDTNEPSITLTDFISE